jgi:hypothetical protein
MGTEDEFWNSDLTPEQRAELMPESTTVERIGNGIALVHRGIKLTPKSQEILFGGETPSPTKFDYISLATDEVAPDPSDESSLAKEYRGFKNLSWVERNLLSRILPKPKKAKQEIINELRQTREDNLTYGLNSEFVGLEGQYVDFSNRVIRRILSGNPKGEDKFMLTKFKQVVQTDVSKPFLIVYGHGRTSKKSWEIGEADWGTHTDLSSVLEHMDVDKDKYSAVLLVSCNEAKTTPPILGNTPIFYVEGIAGGISNYTSKVANLHE